MWVVGLGRLMGVGMRYIRFYKKLAFWERFGIQIVVGVAAFSLTMLFTGFFEGGAFVSMLTLGVVTGAVASKWPTVSQIEVFGSVIRLQRLSRDAEEIIQDLERSRIASYRLFLHTVLNLGASTEPTKKYNEYPEDKRGMIRIDVKEGDVIRHVLDEIESAGLQEELADDLNHAMSLMVIVLAARMCEYVASNGSFVSQRDCDDPDSPQKVLHDYEIFLQKYGDSLPEAESTAMQNAVDNMRMFLYWEGVAKSFLY